MVKINELLCFAIKLMDYFLELDCRENVDTQSSPRTSFDEELQTNEYILPFFVYSRGIIRRRRTALRF